MWTSCNTLTKQNHWFCSELLRKLQYQHERHRIQDSSPEKGQKIKKVIITNDKFKAQVILHTVLQRDQNKTGSQTAETIKSTDGKEANQLQSD